MTEDSSTSHRTPRQRGCWWVLALLCLCTAIVIPNALLWWKFDKLQAERSKERLFWTLCQPGFSEQQRSEAFSELLWLGNAEWRSARLARLDLSGAQLLRADIQIAGMEGCKLVGADLTGAVLRQTQFDQADLSKANLARANLFEADLIKAELGDANFDYADLRGCGLEQTNAPRASFVSADLTGAQMELSKLVEADLRLARLVETDLRLADLSSANLTQTDLTNTTLDHTIFRNANWWRAKGLTPDQIASLQLRFPPDDKAPVAIKEDYEKWLKASIE